jgi:hypothetical protein
MGYFGCLDLLMRGIFWILLWRGYDELGPRWTLILATVWLAGWGLSHLIPGGPYLFIALAALLDIVLVLVVYGGDIRIT